MERLLTLTATLLTAERPLTAEELRGRIDGYPESLASFRRAFERDKEDLREMGVPLRVEEVFGSDPPTVGYRIRREDYYLRDPGFDTDELAAVQLAASLVRLDPVRGLDGLWKLGGSESGDPTAEALADLPGDPRLTPLFRAIAERAEVSFDYGGERRVVQPHRLEFQRGRWYLTGHDRSRTAERNFRVDRMSEAVDAGKPGAFDRPSVDTRGTPTPPWQFGEGEPVLATVAVDREQAPWMARQVGREHVIERHDDGSIVVALEVTNVAAFRSFVLTYLDHAEVLSPPELRSDLIAWLEAILVPRSDGDDESRGTSWPN